LDRSHSTSSAVPTWDGDSGQYGLRWLPLKDRTLDYRRRRSKEGNEEGRRKGRIGTLDEKNCGVSTRLCEKRPTG
jgi:hypothetical protein